MSDLEDLLMAGMVNNLICFLLTITIECMLKQYRQLLVYKGIEEKTILPVLGMVNELNDVKRTL